MSEERIAELEETVQALVERVTALEARVETYQKMSDAMFTALLAGLSVTNVVGPDFKDQVVLVANKTYERGNDD